MATHERCLLALLLLPKQRQLALLRIEPHQCPHNLFQHPDLLCGSTVIELATLYPSRVALSPHGELTLGFGDLLGK